MFTSASKWIGCTAFAALALLSVDSRARLGTRDPWISYSTAVGELRHVALPDGSRVDLNTGSEIRARAEAGRREVILTRGEARFHIERGNGLPSFVFAGNSTVRAAGTEFSIRLHSSGQTDVLVEQGRIDVVAADPESGFAGIGSSSPLFLSISSGESVSLKANTVYRRERLTASTLKRRTSWTDGWISFSQEPLPEAIAELNRYNRRQLVLVDPALASLEIGGRFRSSDLDSFIATLEHSFEVRAKPLPVHQTGVVAIYLFGRCNRAQRQCNWPLAQ